MSSLPESEHFSVWILQQQQMVMMFLGKIANPMTGENERNLDAARWHIDLLGAMQERTKGNLLEHEERLLSQVVTNRRLNFVHEANRPEGSESSDAGAGAPAEGSAESAGDDMDEDMDDDIDDDIDDDFDDDMDDDMNDSKDDRAADAAGDAKGTAS